MKILDFFNLQNIEKEFPNSRLSSVGSKYRNTENVFLKLSYF